MWSASVRPCPLARRAGNFSTKNVWGINYEVSPVFPRTDPGICSRAVLSKQFPSRGCICWIAEVAIGEGSPAVIYGWIQHGSNHISCFGKCCYLLNAYALPAGFWKKVHSLWNGWRHRRLWLQIGDHEPDIWCWRVPEGMDAIGMQRGVLEGVRLGGCVSCRYRASLVISLYGKVDRFFVCRFLVCRFFVCPVSVCRVSASRFFVCRVYVCRGSAWRVFVCRLFGCRSFGCRVFVCRDSLCRVFVCRLFVCRVSVCRVSVCRVLWLSSCWLSSFWLSCFLLVVIRHSKHLQLRTSVWKKDSENDRDWLKRMIGSGSSGLKRMAEIMEEYSGSWVAQENGLNNGRI